MKYCPNKVISANAKGITIYPGNKKKHHWISYPENSPLKKMQVVGELYKHKRYQPMELSPVQHRLLNEALYGLSQYSPEQLATISLVQKARIAELHQKAQQLLFQWKIDIVNEKVDRILLALLPKSRLVRAITGMSFEDVPGNGKAFTLGELGITKDMVAEKLVAAGILPQDFYSLNVQS